jgi:hypothetical protein
VSSTRRSDAAARRREEQAEAGGFVRASLSGNRAA